MVERCHSERYALTDLAQPFEEALQLGLVPLRASRRSQIQSPVVVVAAHPLQSCEPPLATARNSGPLMMPAASRHAQTVSVRSQFS
jgi:hypothetical protein